MNKSQKFCTGCGSALSSGASFCTGCGHEVPRLINDANTLTGFDCIICGLPAQNAGGTCASCGDATAIKPLVSEIDATALKSPAVQFDATPVKPHAVQFPVSEALLTPGESRVHVARKKPNSVSPLLSPPQVYQPQGDPSAHGRRPWWGTALIIVAVFGLTTLAFVGAYLAIYAYNNGTSSISWLNGLGF